MKKILKILLIVIVITACLAGVYTAVANLTVYFSVKDSIFGLDNIPDDDSYDAVVVLGCGLKKDGTPSDMLYDRIMTGVKVAEKNPSAKLVMSGDHYSRQGYDEVGQMKLYAVNAGIDESRIICDGYGLCTYDTFARLSKQYDFKRIVAVTQRYHLNRSVYTAMSFGFDCDGVSADPRSYQFVWANYIRDFIAVDKYFITTRTRPEPIMGYELSPDQLQ